MGLHASMIIPDRCGNNIKVSLGRAENRENSLALLSFFIKEGLLPRGMEQHIEQLNKEDVEELVELFDETYFLKKDCLEEYLMALSFMRKLLYAAGNNKTSLKSELLIIQKHLVLGEYRECGPFFLSLISSTNSFSS